MSKNKNFYLIKNSEDLNTYIYYGENPPIMNSNGVCISTNNCHLVGTFFDNPIVSKLNDNEIFKLSISIDCSIPII